MKARIAALRIEDLLVIIAILMILTAMILPHFSKPAASGAQLPANAATGTTLAP
jgi:hypothetical protein